MSHSMLKSRKLVSAFLLSLPLTVHSACGSSKNGNPGVLESGNPATPAANAEAVDTSPGRNIGQAPSADSSLSGELPAASAAGSPAFGDTGNDGPGLPPTAGDESSTDVDSEPTVEALPEQAEGDAPAMAGPDAEPEVACDPAEMGPEAMPVSGIGMGMEPAGQFDAAVEIDPGIDDQTIYRPEPLGMIKHPILAWGNGACSRSNTGFSEFLLQLAAEGILVIADGGPSTSGMSSDDGSQLIKAIDWAEAENERPCSKYYHKLDLSHIAVAGQSCGGLMALNASRDPRVTTSMPMNSGLFTRNQALYDELHGPVAIINGGPSDIAYSNGLADFESIESVPIMFANIPVGHGGTYRQDNGGEMGQMAIAWLRWQLLADEGETGKGMFIGDSCGFCNSEWDIMWKMKPQ